MKKKLLSLILVSTLLFTGCETIKEVSEFMNEYDVDKKEEVAEAIPKVEDVAPSVVESTEEQDIRNWDDTATEESEFTNMKVDENTDIIENEFSEGKLLDRYIQFIKSEIIANKDKNIIFSPESMNIAFAIYSNTLSDNDKDELDSILEKNYLNFKSNDTFKIVNRLWLNKNKDINVEEIPDQSIIYEMDMTNSEKATMLKNTYVAQNTDGFIKETPSIFDNTVVYDAMNIIYFKDSWLNGDREEVSEGLDFNNSDNSISHVTAFYDNDGFTTKSENAYSYTMKYQDGFEYTVLLPNKGINLNDIDINKFINGDTERVMDKSVYLIIPEYEADNTFLLTPMTFGIKDYPINPKIYSDDTSAEISQVAKIKFDKKGTEAAAVTEIMKLDNAMPIMNEPLELKCDRPFIYYIKDTLNDEIAFIGVVNKL